MHPLLKLICWLFVHAVVHWHVATFAYAIVPKDDTLRDRVDILEVQHFYDENGRLVFDQLIGWDAKPTEAVVFWRLIKNDSLIPRRDRQTGQYFVLFTDEGGPTRRITAPSFRERWEQFDVELENRTAVPVNDRRPLSGKVRK